LPEESNLIKVIAPAKINLFLEITGRQADGFHDLRTVFQAIDLADTVALETAEKGIALVNDWPELPNSRNNLCWKAAALLMKSHDIKQGVAIKLHKTIPVGAGLGGGSSDAAATLLGLNTLWELGLSRPQLQLVSEGLGADVTFFLSGGSQIGEGRGEKLTALTARKFYFVIVWPRVLLPTAAVYAAWDEQPEQGTATLNAFMAAWEKGEPKDLASHFRNDLQGATERLCPICRELRQELLDAGCLGAMVSGSGSAVFGLAASDRQANDIALEMQARRPQGWIKVAKSLANGAQTIT
jgi:4-diphosphocytidyl-2-C-methyl-D-erythritol kinase